MSKFDERKKKEFRNGIIRQILEKSIRRSFFLDSFFTMTFKDCPVIFRNNL